MISPKVRLFNELAIFKVVGNGNQRVESLRLADVFRAKVVDSTLKSFTFELTGIKKIDAFAELMAPLGLEIARTEFALLRGTILASIFNNQRCSRVLHFKQVPFLTNGNYHILQGSPSYPCIFISLFDLKLVGPFTTAPVKCPVTTLLRFITHRGKSFS